MLTISQKRPYCKKVGNFGLNFQAIILIIVFTSIFSCETESTCYGGIKIVDKVEVMLKQVRHNQELLIDSMGLKYEVCNFKDTLTINQTYYAKLNILTPVPDAKAIGILCEIESMKIQPEQNIQFFTEGYTYLYVSGGADEDGDNKLMGTQIKNISFTKIQYIFIEKTKGKMIKEIKGFAFYNTDVNAKIETYNGELESAFKFTDTINNVDLLISKDYRYDESKLRLWMKEDLIKTDLMSSK